MWWEKRLLGPSTAAVIGIVLGGSGRRSRSCILKEAVGAAECGVLVEEDLTPPVRRPARREARGVGEEREAMRVELMKRNEKIMDRILYDFLDRII